MRGQVSDPRKGTGKMISLDIPWKCTYLLILLASFMLGPVEMLGHWARKFVLTSHWVRQNWNRSEAFRILWNILKHRHTEVAYPVKDCPFCIVFRRQRKTNPSLKQQHYRVEWLRQIIGGFLLRTARSSHRSVHVELWCEEVALRQLKLWFDVLLTVHYSIDF